MRLLQLLQEDRVQFLHDKYLEPMMQRYREESGQGDAQIHPETLFNQFRLADPTRDKKYLQWLIRLYLKQGMRGEDLGKAQRYLIRFEQLKPRLPVELRDPNRFRTLGDFYAKVIEPYVETDTTSQRQIDAAIDQELKKQVRVVYKGPEGAVYVPETEQASCFLGRGTQWCTAATNENMFKQYSDHGPLYVVITPDGKKAQFHFERGQFMDENDREIPMNPAKVQSADGKGWDKLGGPNLRENYRWLGKIPELAKLGEEYGALWMFEKPSDRAIAKHLMSKPYYHIGPEYVTPGVLMELIDQRASVEMMNRLIDKYPDRFTFEVMWKIATRRPILLASFKEVDDVIQRHAIEISPDSLEYIVGRQDDLAVERAVKAFPPAIQYAHDQFRFGMLALREEPHTIQWIHAPDDEMIRYMLTQHPKETRAFWNNNKALIYADKHVKYNYKNWREVYKTIPNPDPIVKSVMTWPEQEGRPL